MNSGVFLQANDLAKEAMHELAEVAYQSAKSLQSSLDLTKAEFEETRSSFSLTTYSQDIQGGLAAYAMSVRDATALNLMQNGSMRALAQAQLGLAGVTEESMSSGQRASILAKEQALVQKKAMETADKAREFLEKIAMEKVAAEAADEKAATEMAKITAALLDMTFNKIPAGTFLLGSPVTEKDRDDDEDQHKVTISKPFYMQTTEVTQGQWTAVMGTEPWKGQSRVKEGPDYPAVYVSWNDAVAYCEKLSMREGETYRLPTEAEWEYACRAGTTTTWSFGDDEASLGDYAWYKENAFDIDEMYAHQVSLKEPNVWSLYDMYGNAWEWCSDYYGKDYYIESPQTDPTGPTSGSSRVLRGGSWNNSSRFTRSAVRLRYGADNRYSNVGFRLVRELD